MARTLPPPGDEVAWRMRSGFFSTLLLAAAPLAAPLVAHRLWVRRKALVGLKEKFGGAGAAIEPGAVMIHGVSLGEVLLMRALVPKLEAALGCRCLLTTTTETGRAALDQHFPDHQRAYLPFDLPWAVERFLARARPRAIVLLELEIWPLLLCAAHRRGIPVALVNARVGDRSFRGYLRARAVLAPLLRAMAVVLAQNAQWAARLVALGARRERTEVGGSMKADMVRRADAGQAQAEADRLGLRTGVPVLLLASTSAGAVVEERLVLDQRLEHWRERGWQVVICPRHPERGQELSAMVAALGTAPHLARRSSAGERLDGERQVMIVDEIGRLGALYAWTAQVGGIAVVGGSLGSGRGGQNMLEAAAAGCCTVVGWDTRNFPDAMALLRAAGGVVEVAKDDVHARLAALSDDSARRRTLGESAQRAWREGQGAVEQSVRRLAAVLDAAPRRRARR